ncbi:Serine/threonine-protein kinase [Nowakowskiella sp. JEL0078]|nr:Serine/threonine-protein kinase [Nowakowskiella sp. JEL0078]
MGNIQSGVTPAVAIDNYVSELPDVHYEKRLDGYVVVKIFVKPDNRISLKAYSKALRAERDALLHVPNTFAYQRVKETERAGYLIRQYMFSSLYDRISTRPFLNLAEKKWIAFQLISGLSAAHKRQIYHGDIKTENVLVTSWNWVFLSDFSSFKPTFLPEDNPADFSFYFDTSSRRTCYLAPERFYSPGETLFSSKNGSINAGMDIFSLGDNTSLRFSCTLAELFMEGTPLFSLAQLLRYRSAEYDPTPELNKIECPYVSEMIKHMIQLDPSRRYPAHQYLSDWKGTALPEIFSTFLHQYVASMTDPSTSFNFAKNTDNLELNDQTLILPSKNKDFENGTGDEDPPISNLRESDSDSKIERIYYDFGKIATALNLKIKSNLNDKKTDDREHAIDFKIVPENLRVNISQDPFPMRLNIPNFQHLISDIEIIPEARDVCLIFVTIVCACIRNTMNPSSRLFAIDLLLAFSIQIPDAYYLDRCVPYLVTLLADENASVRAHSLKALTQLLILVESVTPIDSNIFPEYILPSLKLFPHDKNVFVRSTYAQCIATIAETASKFLELSEIFKNTIPSNQEAELEPTHITYDSALRELHESIQDDVTALLEDEASSVKRSILLNMARLCIFFGKQRANDVLLSHMITYLNVNDWQLRAAFFESIVGVGMFVGDRSLEEFILPLMIQSLNDSEEFVVEKVLNALTSLGELGLLHKPKLKELAYVVLPLVWHPNVWIRYRSTAFVACVAKLLPVIDVRCILYPMLRPYLKADIFEINDVSLLEFLKEPVSRVLYDQTLLFASKPPQSRNTYSSPPRQKNPSSPENLIVLGSGSIRQISNSNLISSSTGDNDLLQKLRELGMTEEDKEKLMAMREYIFKSAKVKAGKTFEPKFSNSDDLENKSGIVPLKNFQVTPQTVFLTPPIETFNPTKTNAPVVDSDFADEIKPNLKQRTVQTLTPPTVMKTFNNESLLVPPSRINSLNLLINSSQPQPQLNASEFDTKIIPIPERSKSSTGMITKSKPAATSLISEPVMATLEVFGTSISSESGSIGGVRVRSEGGGAFQRSLLFEQSDSASEITNLSTLPDSNSDVLSRSPIYKNNSSPLLAQIQISSDLKFERTSSTSSYQKPNGQARYLQSFLEKKERELFPPNIKGGDLGPKVAPLTSSNVLQPRSRRSKAAPVNDLPSNTDLRHWRPQGLLVAQLSEHNGAVNKIRVAPDHTFFASCSDDGTVKIWDSRRIERNATNRSRLSYSTQGGKIMSITFCENTRSIASASQNGTIHIGRVDYISSSNSAPKYNGYETMRTLSLENGDYPILLEHFDYDSQSVLLYSTFHGKMCGFDLRTMRTCWEFQHEAHNGVPSAMLSEPRRHNWIVSGTHRGVFSLWDVRFGLSVKTWSHPSRSRINTIVPHWSSNPQGRFVLAAVQGWTNEVSSWDIDNAVCKEVWCVVGNPGTNSDPEKDMQQLYGNGLKAATPPDASDISTYLKSSSNQFETPPPSSKPSLSLKSSHPPVFYNRSPDFSVRSIVNHPDMPYMLTVGTDRKIRYWDHSSVDKSYIVTGLDSESSSPKYASHMYGDVTFNLEHTPQHGILNPTQSTFINKSKSSRINTEGGRVSNGGSSPNVKNEINPAPIVGGGVVSPVAASHLDAILDTVVMQVPFNMIVSSGRDGVITVHR